MKKETKGQRFVRVAEKRVQNVLDSIRRLSQCSNPRMYEWEDYQLKKIWGSIDTELKKCKKSYETNREKVFKL